jgi:integrase/recombinase XerD
MPRTNPKNDRVKREYLVYLKDARQRSAATVDQVRHAIDRLESYTGFKDFGTFNKEQALGFKRALLATKALRSGKPISIATAYHVLQALKEFLAWLHSRSGRRIDPTQIAYLNLTTNEERTARVTSPKSYATIEQYRAALFAMPIGNEMGRRDQALLALLLLTAMRDTAVIGLKLKHISVERRFVFQDPREIKTKFRKPIETTFLPVGEDVVAIVGDWIKYLVTEKLYGPGDPLFPKTAVQPDEHRSFAARGLTRDHWANAEPVRQIFRTAFDRVNLPYVKPHSIRDTVTQLAYKLQLNLEQMKAFSQNIGHDSMLTTLCSYGPVSPERQAEIIRTLGQPDVTSNHEMATEIAMRVVAMMNR